MVEHRVNLKSWVVAAVFAAGGMFCSAQTAPPANAPIFSKPADADVSAPETSDSIPTGNGSEKVFHNPDYGEPLPPPSSSPDLNPALQKELNQRAEWTLQTPEEIMGLQTPEEILGLKSEDQDENASPEERYLQRQEKAQAAAATEHPFDASRPAHEYVGMFDRPDDRDPLFSPHDQNDPGAFGHMFSESEASPFVRKSAPLAGAKPTSGYGQDQAKVDQQQAAELARFRSLIGEVPEAPNPALTAPHLDANPASDPLATFDPFGHPAVSHPVDPSKPDGLTLSPEFKLANEQPRKTKKPSWEPQAPPWISDNLNPPTAPPVRKFY